MIVIVTIVIVTIVIVTIVIVTIVIVTVVIVTIGNNFILGDNKYYLVNPHHSLPNPN